MNDTHTHIHTYIHTYIYTHTYTHTYIHTHTCIHTYIHTHPYIHTDIHTATVDTTIAIYIFLQKNVEEHEILMLISTIRSSIRFDHRHPSKERTILFINTPKHIQLFTRAFCICPIHNCGVSFSMLTIPRKVDKTMWKKHF